MKNLDLAEQNSEGYIESGIQLIGNILSKDRLAHAKTISVFTQRQNGPPDLNACSNAKL
jgi:hypothetical protein